MSKVSILKLQGAIFFKPTPVQNTTGLISALNASIEKRFDGDPVALPIPIDAPAEIPRLILKSKNDSLIFQASLMRSDIVFKPLDNQDASFHKNEFQKILNNLFKSFQEHTKCEITRLAYLPTFVCQIEKNAAQLLFEKYCTKALTDKFSDDLTGLNIHLLKRWQKDDIFKLNRWIKINSRRSLEPAAPENEFYLELDFNTWGEETELRVFDIKPIQNFFEYCWAESLKIKDEILK